ncbi:non-ribosomal peptide synthetase [Saccharothrix syringae]|uniref:non-ribosomal peptide synthetase n=1 Tax=Saccharothrix syringae TaxID=103733 RepID=UPI00068F2712|nr:non-ribosomal peptide synthetase [Saccharothrix syringae]
MLQASHTPRADSARRTTVPERIAAWAARRPAAVAVVDEHTSVTYGDFQQRVDALADRLRRLGVRRDERVAVYLERSADCVLAAAAVLASGAAYLMLDVRQPAAWTRLLLDRGAARVVITRPDLWATTAVEGLSTVDVTTARRPLPIGAPPRPAEPVPDDAAAYLNYTSGSSGAPKGVLVEHAGLANLVDWYLQRHRVGPDDHLTQLARPSFDAFALEVWPCLAAGAALHVVPPALTAAPAELRDWLCRSGITVAFVPTPLAEQLLELPWPDRGRLRDVLVGGDRLTAYPGAALPFRLHNNYGPTECTVVATCCEVPPGGPPGEPPPIGTPIPGVSAYVLDERRRPVADGEPGELHLGGVGVARGYLGDPERNGFWADPFSAEPAARAYATGDLVRRAPDGQLHFLGRVDDQVQVRGIRVDPGEVEPVLRSHPTVDRAVVVGRDRQLVAYVTAGDGPVDPAALRRFLQARLPDYLVPAVVVPLDELPTTGHGKVDRRALAGLPLRRPEAEPPPEPADDLERVLTEAWLEVLDATEVHPHDNFFEIGGDSLRVSRLVGRSRQRGLVLRPDDVYAHPVLRDLAAALREQRSTAVPR